MPKKLTFTETEADLVGRTADAMSAYMGKPVLAEIVSEPEYEWALFAIPLLPKEETEGVYVQVGGAGARIMGNAGGLSVNDEQAIDCELLWALQLTQQENIRFIKIDADGEEVAWAEHITEILPFDLKDPEVPEDD